MRNDQSVSEIYNLNLIGLFSRIEHQGNGRTPECAALTGFVECDFVI